MESSEFFNVQPVQAALDLLLHACPLHPQAQTCPTIEALGRVLLTSPRSPLDLPTFTRSTMDGYAVRAADTFGASASLPTYLSVIGSVRMGEIPPFEIKQGQAAEIHTGAMLPTGADGVVMLERTQRVTDGEIEVLAPIAPGENLAQIGEDIGTGAVILPAGQRLRPQDIGGLLAAGILEVEVAAPPHIAIIGSGDELVPPHHSPTPGQVRDINAYTLAGLCQQAGAIPRLMGIAKDNFEDLLALGQAAMAQADMLLFTAGSSVSTRDLTRAVIQTLGSPGVLQHGLAVKPGKPTILAVCDGKPVIGLPGNPVSAFLVARQVVIPLIQRFLGETPRPTPLLTATLTHNIASVTGREDSVPVKLHQDGEGWHAEPIFGKSNLIFTLIHADGLVLVSLNSNGIKAGSRVEVVLF